MSQPHVALFVTCLVDLFRPSVGFAAVKLLERAGCRVDVPRQTCCGQPAYNQGDRADAIADRAPDHRRVRRLRLRRGAVRLLRRHAEEALSGAVRRGVGRRRRGPRSGRAHLRADQLPYRRARRRDGRGEPARRAPPTTMPARACASSASSSSRAGCSRACAGCSSTSCPNAEVCCGFGGTFCVKYPEISTRMVSDKAADIEATGADLRARGRPRLPHEHGRPPEAPGLAGSRRGTSPRCWRASSTRRRSQPPR